MAHEISFNTDRELRKEVLNAIAPFIEEVMYVESYRPPGHEFVRTPKQVHIALLNELRQDLELIPGEDVLIFVDSNDDLVSEKEVKDAINPTRDRHIECLVLPSRYFFELQGHDMVAGAIGHELNTGDSAYTDILKEKGVRIRGRTIKQQIREIGNKWR